MFAQRDGINPEINISATPVLVALAAGVCLAALLIWAFVKYWLFAP